MSYTLWLSHCLFGLIISMCHVYTFAEVIKVKKKRVPILVLLRISSDFYFIVVGEYERECVEVLEYCIL